jgi:hypothetical protein
VKKEENEEGKQTTKKGKDSFCNTAKNVHLDDHRRVLSNTVKGDLASIDQDHDNRRGVLLRGGDHLIDKVRLQSGQCGVRVVRTCVSEQWV